MPASSLLASLEHSYKLFVLSELIETVREFLSRPEMETMGQPRPAIYVRGEPGGSCSTGKSLLAASYTSGL